MTLADIWNFIIHVDLISVALYGFFIFLGIVIIAYLFMGYIKINEAYNSLFEKIKNPWIRILINYWTWIILLFFIAIYNLVVNI